MKDLCLMEDYREVLKQLSNVSIGQLFLVRSGIIQELNGNILLQKLIFPFLNI